MRACDYLPFDEFSLV